MHNTLVWKKVSYATKWSMVLFGTAWLLSGCGGNSDNPINPPTFSSQVVFGDSLSDVGTYAVGSVASPLGGGRYTINSTLPNGQPTPSNWTEIVAGALKSVGAPCAAETGLDGIAFPFPPFYNFAVPPTFYPNCTNYAQGGAMVTNPYGPGNKHAVVLGSAILGQLTVPIVQQMQNHLNAHGAFSGNEIVFILAGGNDGLINTETYLAHVFSALAGGGAAAAQAQAAISGPVAIQAMTQAGQELAGYINNLILGNGAKHVAVLTLPDLADTPYGAQVEGRFPGTKQLLSQMVQAFNTALQTGLSSNNVLLIDLYQASKDQLANPSAYNISNVTDTACDLNIQVNLLSSALACNTTNLIPGDVSHYAFADTVHPTPYGNMLIALYVIQQLQQKRPIPWAN